MRYLEKRTKIFKRPVILRQRAYKLRPLSVENGASFIGLHFRNWSVLVAKKKTAKRLCKSVGGK
jgi:hypothetical protein